MKSHVKQGYFLDYSGRLATPYRHRFCGNHTVPGAVCPNCNKSLLLLLSLDLSDPRLTVEVGGCDLAWLLFCWTCNLAQSPFFYRQGENSIDIVQCGRGGVMEDFPYQDYPIAFEGRFVSLVEISSGVQHDLRLLNSEQVPGSSTRYRQLAVPRHQVGGEPYLVQHEWLDVLCPGCEADMPFLASFGDDCLDPRGFTGNPYVQVMYHYCEHCRIVGARQQCD